MRRLLVVLGVGTLAIGSTLLALPEGSEPADVHLELAGGDGHGAFTGAPLDRLVLRDAPGGVTLRLYTDATTHGDLMRDPDFAICDLGRSLVIEVSNRGAALQQYASVFTSPDPVAIAAAQTFGAAEGDPGWFAVLRTGDGVTTVAGGGDSADVVDGWAMLGGSGPLPTGAIDALGSDAVLGSARFEDGATPCFAAGEVPRLPVPGEQPGDVEAAEAAVRRAYADAFAHDADPEDRDAAVAHLDDVQDRMDQAAGAFPEAVATVEVTVYEVVFTAPDRAGVRFELNYSGGAEFGEQLGEAVLLDGRWRITRDTMCMVLGWAGAGC